MSIQTPDPTETKRNEIVTVDVGLPASERCDRCGAQAYVEAKMQAGELLFCVHHFVEQEDALVMKALQIIDHRPFLKRQEDAYKGLSVTP